MIAFIIGFEEQAIHIWKPLLLLQQHVKSSRNAAIYKKQRNKYISVFTIKYGRITKMTTIKKINNLKWKQIQKMFYAITGVVQFFKDIYKLIGVIKVNSEKMKEINTIYFKQHNSL